MNRMKNLLAFVILCFSSAALAQVYGPPNTAVNDVVTWSNITGTMIGDPSSFQIVGPSGAMTTMQANTDTQSLLIQGGQDTSAPDTLGGITIRGATVQDSMTGGTGGSVTIQGGDSSSSATSGNVDAGLLTLRPGAATGGSNSVPGRLVISQTFRLGGTYTCPDNMHGGGCRLACMTAHNTVSDCGTSPSANPAINYVGVELPPITLSMGAAANVQLEGIANVESVQSGAQWAIGDIVCVDACNGGFVVDNGTNACTTMTCPAGQLPTKQVGIVTLGGSVPDSYLHTIILAR